MPEVAPMLMVCAEQVRVEAELAGGVLSCPSCRGRLGPWGHARRRVVRCAAGAPIRPLAEDIRTDFVCDAGDPEGGYHGQNLLGLALMRVATS
jgi:hypothetical protein